MAQILQQNSTVSVCIPSYNHSRYIKDNLVAIFSQTHQPLELIVIDDGSTDNSPEIIKEVLSECPFEAKLIVRENRGLPVTINQGLEMARGEFFAIIASDDIWLPDFLKYRVSQLQKRPEAVLAYGHCYIIDDENNIVGATSDWADYEDGNVRDMLIKKYPPLAVTVLYRKAALEIQKWNPEVFVEDYELFLRLCTLGEFAFDPEKLSGYRIHSTNISRQTESIVKGKIQAFQLNAKILGLSSQELLEVVAKVNWGSSDFLLNSKQRFKAIKLTLQNSHAKIPITKKLQQYLKLLLPNKIIQAKHKIIKRKSNAINGRDIKDLIIQQLGGKKNYNLDQRLSVTHQDS
ncbi:MAG: glycosyltransferase family 2 protein [Acidobacteria bacterium]|nr:glycosyltransferase family 2 protein [Acidobacteriota bacterium]